MAQFNVLWPKILGCELALVPFIWKHSRWHDELQGQFEAVVSLCVLLHIKCGLNNWHWDEWPSYMHSVSFRYMIKDVQESFGLSDAEVILLEQVRADSETGSVLVGQPKGQRERERDDEMTRWHPSEMNRGARLLLAHGVRNDLKWILLGVSGQLMLQSKSGQSPGKKIQWKETTRCRAVHTVPWNKTSVSRNGSEWVTDASASQFYHKMGPP